MHCLLLLLIDVVLVALSTVTASALSSSDTQLFLAIERAAPYGFLTLLVAVPVLLLFRLNRTVWRFASLSDCALILAASVTIVLLSSSLGFVVDGLTGIPRSLPVMQGLLILYALGGVRVAMRMRHARRRRARQNRNLQSADRQNVLLVGLNPIANLFLACAAESGDDRLQIVGILSETERHRGRMLRRRKILGPPETVKEALIDLSVHGVFIDRIVVALPPRALSEKTQQSLSELASTGKIRVDYLSPQLGLSETEWAPAKLGTATDWQTSPPSAVGLPSRSYLRCKRLVDATIALVCAVSFSPLMFAVYVIVLLDVGAPAIFWQQRPGAGGRPIRVLKFRTMGPPRDKHGRTLSDDERLSKIGSLLRRFRLDELPQVYNVLLGHMSLVGPRPLLPADQPAASAARLWLRPGVTGWAQIKGGRHLSIEDKAALDLWYIRNASLALDVRILLDTVRTVLFGERVDRDAIQEAWRDLRNPPPEPSTHGAFEHNPA